MPLQRLYCAKTAHRASVWRRTLYGYNHGLPLAGAAIFGMLLMSAVYAQQASDSDSDEAADRAPEKTEVEVQAEVLAAAQARANKANLFNRTMRPLASYNLPPAEDGIHDSGNDSIEKLSKPLDAYTELPRNKAGNRVDWVAALASGKIAPRWGLADANAEGMVMDMDIVRVPRGSIHNVVFPHKQHTEWLACSNCHPAIFVPQKGANQISMPLILSGQKCGICHGTVAFPPSECSKCHSQKKDAPQNEAGTP